MNPQGHAVVGASQPRSIERLEDHSPREHSRGPLHHRLKHPFGSWDPSSSLYSKCILIVFVDTANETSVVRDAGIMLDPML